MPLLQLAFKNAFLKPFRDLGFFWGDGVGMGCGNEPPISLHDLAINLSLLQNFGLLVLLGIGHTNFYLVILNTGSGKTPGRGHGNPLHCSCLENLMDRGTWQATVHGVRKSQARLSN